MSDPSEGLIWETTFPLQHVRVFGKKRYAATDEKGELRVQDHQAANFMSELASQSPRELVTRLNRSFFVSCSQRISRIPSFFRPKTERLPTI